MTSHSDDPAADIDWLVVDRYLAGTASEADAAAVERWMAADPVHALLIEDLRSARAAGERERPTAWDTSRLWACTEREIRDGRLETRARGVRRRFHTVLSSRPWIVPAVSVAIVAACMAVWPVLSPLLRRSTADLGSNARAYVTRPGERVSAQLSDGTRIIVGPESRLVVPSAFGSTRRDVYVEGEAYFIVRHDATRPFAVHARDATTEDIGTAFAVRAYASEPGIRVVVGEGTVRLSTGTASAAHSVILDRGDIGAVDGGQLAIIARGRDVRDELAWTEGRLVFDEALAGDALRDLSRWYGVEVRVSDPVIARGRITASFSTTSAEEAVDRLARLLGGRAEWRGRNALITTGTERSR